MLIFYKHYVSNLCDNKHKLQPSIKKEMQKRVNFLTLYQKQNVNIINFYLCSLKAFFNIHTLSVTENVFQDRTASTNLHPKISVKINILLLKRKNVF